MHILFVHNAYQQRGGEDSVVQAEIDLLRHYGHEVALYRRDNREIDRLPRLALVRDTVWSRRAARELRALVESFQPDVVHLHNTFPLISPSAYWALAALDRPMVQTLHNFRPLCLEAGFLRRGRVCEDCLGRFPWRGVLRRCYRGSAGASATLATMLAVHRTLGSFERKVTRYIALGRFVRDKYVQAGWPARRIAIKPNFVDIARVPERPRHGGLYVGRLTEGKGLAVMLDAVQRLPAAQVEVVGTGPLASSLPAHGRVRTRGWQDPPQVYESMRRAAYLLFPSLWYEGFPRTLVEAFACGLPVIASRMGAMAELIEDGRTGLLFQSGSAVELADRIAWAEAHPEAMREMGANARAEYEAKYTPEKNYWQLMTIYADAIEHRRQDDELLASHERVRH